MSNLSLSLSVGWGHTCLISCCCVVDTNTLRKKVQRVRARALRRLKAPLRKKGSKRCARWGAGWCCGWWVFSAPGTSIHKNNATSVKAVSSAFLGLGLERPYRLSFTIRLSLANIVIIYLRQSKPQQLHNIIIICFRRDTTVRRESTLENPS